MEYFRSGERNFIYDHNKYVFNYVRVNEQTEGYRLCLGFEPSGLHVFDGVSEDACGFVCFATARKSFGYLNN